MLRSLCFAVVFLTLLPIFSSSCQRENSPAANPGPNIVLIVADDMGFSDLGCFGSEIATPNIDALAAQGHIFSNFYTAATCSPTRAMLLSGTDNHVAGLGDMAERMQSMPQLEGKPGYEGHLNNRVVSIAQLLLDQGYHTYMAGKWHLGRSPDQSPQAKGFERSFALMDAYTNHYFPYQDNLFWADEGYTQYPNGQYSTDLYTEKMMGFLRQNQGDQRPFFLYAAYTSPHWPLQAPENFIEKYRGVYDIGFDSLRVRRFQGLLNKGILPDHAVMPPVPNQKGALYAITSKMLLPWEALTRERKKIEAHKMEIYAAMIHNLDYNIGRLIDYLKQTGQFENTMFVFLSDNGAAVLEENYTPPDMEVMEAMGTVNSFVAYGPAWAHASSAAFRLYKGYSMEGGIHTPMIVKMPGQSGQGTITSTFTTVMDLAPTLLELADGTYPSSYHNTELAPYRGESMLSMLNGEQDYVHDQNYSVGWELFGRCALRKGSWKITKVESPFGTNRFELYNLQDDPGEMHDLSEAYPEKYQELMNEWERYVKENGVILVGY